MELARTFEQLELLLIDPIQYDYEVIRPVLLYVSRRRNDQNRS